MTIVVALVFAMLLAAILAIHANDEIDRARADAERYRARMQAEIQAREREQQERLEAARKGVPEGAGKSNANGGISK